MDYGGNIDPFSKVYMPHLGLDGDIPTHKYNKFDILKLPIERSFENISIDQVRYFYLL